MVSAFFALTAGAAVLLCVWLYKTYTHWKRNGVPTAKGSWPFLGHMLPVFMGTENFTDMISRVYNEYKDCSMVGVYKSTVPVLVIREPSLVKTVLQNNFSSFHENGQKLIPEADPLLSYNPFFNSGEVWAVGRKRLTHAFTNTRLKNMFAIVVDVCSKFQAYVDRRLKSTDSYEVELKTLFSKFTGEVVANAGVGVEGMCFEDEEHPYAFDQIGSGIFKPSNLEAFLTLITLLFPKANRLLKISLVPKKLSVYFRRLVAENLQRRRKSTTGPPNDFIQLMLEFETKNGQTNEDAIAGHAFSFYGDGFETSSITLSFVGYHLALRPEIQEKLREEVTRTLAAHGGELTFESLKEMTYMDCVINESLRCYPAVGVMNKACTEEFELQGSDGLRYRAKPGDEIVVSVFGLHRDPKYWPNPDEFDPDRFSEDRKQKIEKMTHLPFGDGPRICVGMRMAMLQMKACLATLLRSYRLQLSPKTQRPLKLSPFYFLTAPVGGLWVHLSKL